MRPRWNSSHSRNYKKIPAFLKKKETWRSKKALKDLQHFLFFPPPFSLHKFISFFGANNFDDPPHLNLINSKQKKVSYLFGVKNMIIIQGHAIPVTIGWCSNNTHVVGISPTRGKWINRPFFFPNDLSQKRPSLLAKTHGRLFFLTLRIRWVIHTHTQVQALAFNKNKSEKAFLWTKRSPRECNSNWPMLPFPPLLVVLHSCRLFNGKNFEFFSCPRGLYRQASSGHILNLFIRFDHFHH